MRRHYLFAILIVLFVSCTKNSTSTNAEITGKPSLKYKINGQLIQYSGGDSEYRASGYGVFSFNLSPGNAPSNTLRIQGANPSKDIVFIGIPTKDSLKLQTYNINYPVSDINASEFRQDSSSYGIRKQGDQLKVTITRHTNHTIDGTFSGSCTGYVGLFSLGQYTVIEGVLTEGEFKNVRVLY